MTERAGELRAVAGGDRPPRFGLVFCELPPAVPPRRRPAKPTSGSTARPAGRSAKRAHGTYAKAVVEGCDCQRCKKAKAAYSRGRKQAIADPDKVWLPFVSAEPARRHLAALSAAGVGLKTVGRLSGVSHGALSKIVYGEPGRGRPPSRRVRPQTLQKILAVKVSDAPSGQRVSAGRTWQLIDELVAAGYTRAELAEAMGSQAAEPWLQIGRRTVRASTALAVERLHRDLLGRKRP